MSSSLLEVILGVRNAPFKQGLDEAREMAREFRGELSSEFARALTFGGIVAGIESLMEYAKQVRNLSDSYGVSTTILQQWGAAAVASGKDLEELAGSFNDLEIARSEAVGGDDEMIKNFKALGVTIEELRDLDVGAIMMKIAHGTMNAANMGRVMGEESVRLRPMLKALADGSVELASAMEEKTVNALASAARQMESMKHEFTVGGGVVTVFFYKVTRSAIAAAEGIMALSGAVPMLAKMTGQAVLGGDLPGAMDVMKMSIDSMRATFQGFKEEVEAPWKTEALEAPERIGREAIETSEKQQQEIDKEISLRERLETLQRQIAMEQADDQEKMIQLLDREMELRQQAANLDQESTDGMEARIAIEETVLQIQQLQNQMDEKEKQNREQQQKEREAQAKKFADEVRAAEQQLRDEQDKLAVMRAQNTEGDAEARRLERQLEYTNRIRDLEDQIAKAREAGNRNLVDILQTQQGLLQQQAQLANDPTQRMIDANGGKAPSVTELRRKARVERQQQRVEDRTRQRLVNGLMPTKRDINGNPIEGIDEDGKIHRIEPPVPKVDPFTHPDPRNPAAPDDEIMGPPMPPKPGVDAPGPDPVVAKLDEIKDVLDGIKEVASPALHIGG